MVYAGETHHFVNTVGNSQTGVQVCYGECLIPGNSPLISINYLSFGTSSSCAEFRVVPHPDAEAIEVIDCGGTPKSAWGGVIFVNPSVVCNDCPGTVNMFPGTAKYFSCEPLRVETSSWGAIKALYQ